MSRRVREREVPKCRLAMRTYFLPCGLPNFVFRIGRQKDFSSGLMALRIHIHDGTSRIPKPQKCRKCAHRNTGSYEPISRLGTCHVFRTLKCRKWAHRNLGPFDMWLSRLGTSRIFYPPKVGNELKGTYNPLNCGFHV